MSFSFQIPQYGNRTNSEVLAGPTREGLCLLQGEATRYGVNLWVIHYWIERSLVSAVQRKNAPYAIAIDDAVDRRLRK